jgi:hypothetical protein
MSKAMDNRLEKEAFQLLARRHSERFRKVSNRYPRRVAEAYEGDLSRALRDSDEEVTATVAAWERRQGLDVTDWALVGEQEREK